MFSFNYAGRNYTAADFENGKLKTDNQLLVSATKVEYEEFDAYESLLWFENTGDSDSRVISDIKDCDVVFPFEIDKTKRKPWGYIPDKNDLCVISMNGMVEAERYWENDAICTSEFMFNYDYLCKLPDGKKSFENRGGRSSDRFMPIFDITVNDGGYILAIGWTGDWKAEFTECDEGELVWVPKADLDKLKLWEGDKIFFKLLEEEDRFFTLKLTYKGEELVDVQTKIY